MERGQTEGSNTIGVADWTIYWQALAEMVGKPYRRGWESRKRKSESGVSIQSTGEHEEFAGKPGGPPPKPKYSLMTDSE